MVAVTELGMSYAFSNYQIDMTDTGLQQKTSYSRIAVFLFA